MAIQPTKEQETQSHSIASSIAIISVHSPSKRIHSPPRSLLLDVLSDLADLLA